MKKAYLFLADGFEEIEGLTVVDILRRAGVDICTVSIMGKKEITGAHQIEVKADARRHRHPHVRHRMRICRLMAITMRMLMPLPSHRY